MNNEFILMDRIQKIRQIINIYGEDQFYISFSGGRDSCVLSALIDMAIPNNSIPRVYADTGIELNMIKDFVRESKKSDPRIIIIKPSKSIKTMLENEGYPFKSKIHSHCVNLYQTKPDAKMWRGYIGLRPDNWHSTECPKMLQYQFTDENKLRISDQCCVNMKEKPLIEWSKTNNRSIALVGIMKEEDGRRLKSSCLIFRGKKLTKFQPLITITKEWESWYISNYDVAICDIYKPPYNFNRTGCKGCPFAIKLQDELDTLEKFFPNERKQCEIIWKPVYDEYRRLNYRLKRR